MLFIYYPKCSTCRLAKAWLDDNNIRYEERLIVEDPPTAKDLLRWSKKKQSAADKICQYERSIISVKRLGQTPSDTFR